PRIYNNAQSRNLIFTAFLGVFGIFQKFAANWTLSFSPLAKSHIENKWRTNLFPRSNFPIAAERQLPVLRVPCGLRVCTRSRSPYNLGASSPRALREKHVRRRDYWDCHMLLLPEALSHSEEARTDCRQRN